MSDIPRGWMGEESELMHTLAIFRADQDEDGKFLIYEEPVVKGLDGSIVVHQRCEYSVGGQRRNFASALNSTSYGLGVVVL